MKIVYSLPVTTLLGALTIGACSTEFEAEIEQQQSIRNGRPLVPPRQAIRGERLFHRALRGSNGRACGDCHVAADHHALTPAHVQNLLATDPNHPLFADVDVDVLGSGVRSFNNLSHGLARVILTLPDNMDVIDLAGNVITNADRTIEVWRSVPSIDNTFYTADYLHDGRAATLEEQALGAFEAHSAPTRPIRRNTLRMIAQFERTQFSSDRARFVAEQIAAGVPEDQIPNPEDSLAFLASLTDEELRGKEVFERACAPCHGGVTGDKIEFLEVSEELCVKTRPDGNLIFDFTDANGNGVLDPEEAGTIFAERSDERCDPNFMNIGTSITTVLGQLGAAGIFNGTAQLPQYRFRFYTDGTRTQQKTDLPPVPVLNPDGTPAVDARGLPIVGPGGLPQLFSTDPGRAAITGRPEDFEAFAIPQLRGIANTGPYFHDNTVETLTEMVDFYSVAVLPFMPAMGLPPIHPSPIPTFFGGQSLTEQEKPDLVAYLKRL